jgi:hypothetical protein
MPSTAIEQLRSLQAQVNALIDTHAQGEQKESLFALDQVGKEVSLKPQDPQLAKLSATLSQMQAVVLGDKLPFQRAFEVSIRIHSPLLGLSIALRGLFADIRISLLVPRNQLFTSGY